MNAATELEAQHLQNSELNKMFFFFRFFTSGGGRCQCGEISERSMLMSRINQF